MSSRSSQRRRQLLRKDLELFQWVADTRTPWLDSVLPPLSRSADHGLIWLGTAAALGLSRGARRRAAVRGLLSLANIPAKLSVRRSRPPLDGVALARRLHRQPSTLSFPSGHATSAAAFAVGVALETPRVGAAIGVLAGAVAYSRVYTGVHYPGDVAAGLVLGAGCALLTTQTWPRRPGRPAKGRSVSHLVEAMPEGEGLVVVVNKASGKASRGTYAHDIRAALPKADVQEREPTDVTEALQAAGRKAPAIGVVGGDGTVNVAASIALEAGKPLAVFPGGTLDHFAQDIGISSSEDTIAAVRAGTAAAVEIGRIGERGDQIFLNTASLGGYPEMVATRERLEEYLGKWPSVIIAMLRVLRHGTPLELFVDGERRRLWLLFAGNGSYAPSGFAPTYRTDLTDGMLDIRMIDADAPLGRTRLTAAVLSGRLGRSRVYEQRLAEELSLRRADGTDDLAIALDGEVTEALPEIVMCKHPKRLLVFRPED